MPNATRPSKDQAKLNSLSEKIIGLSYKVHSNFGPGYLEKVYENALSYEISSAGIQLTQQPYLNVRYNGIIVGEFQPDIIVDGALLLEIKAVSELNKNHEAQCYSYLKASALKLGLLLNFGAGSVQIRRKVNGF